MIPAIKKRWLKALRSGKYKQAQGKLYDGKDYCCLGVLYDIQYHGDWEQIGDFEYDGAPADAFAGDWIIDKSGGNLSTKFREKCQIPDASETTLIEMNDEGSDFEEIATWIEAEL